MTSTPIAIIGMACRFPRSRTPGEFWKLLHEAQNASADIPPERWAAERYFDADPRAPGKMVTRRAALVEQIDHFDAAFFGISPREATFIDPQQRLFLEVAWEAFEDAGLPPERFAGEPVGCFVGAASNEHAMCILEDTSELEYYVPGSAYSVIANRTSYFFNFNGPSLAVDTACSSGLTAIHLACQSLRSGESILALAGATHALVSPWGSVAVSKMGLLAPDGYCKTFDARADGLGRGEGAGALLLKTLDRALADGDRIRAIIRGSAVNQNGRSNGLYAPSPVAQEAVVRAACRAAGVAPREIEYVEAHGTGTPLGDAIEIKALGAALGDERAPGDKCLIGSVKTNIGHLDAAGGIAGLVKTVLALEHRMIPAHLNFETPAPGIDFDKLPFEVPKRATAWREGGAGLAGVHAVGLGGTNAHVILQWNTEPAVASAPPAHDVHLLGISARGEPALRELAARYAALFQEMSDDPAALADACYTAGVGRSRLTHRLAVVGRRPEDFVAVLQAFGRGENPADASVAQCRAGREPRIGFVIGPGTTSGTDLLRSWGITPHVAVHTAPDPAQRKQADVWVEISDDSVESLLRLAGELFVRGASVDWNGIYRDSARRKVDLPLYAFQRKRFTLLGRERAGQAVVGRLEVKQQAVHEEDSIVRELRDCAPEERPSLAARYVEQSTRRILRVEDGELDMQVPLLAMGFDSIMSTELANALQRDFGFEVPVVAILDGISLQGVVELLCQHLDRRTEARADEWVEGEI